MKKILLVFCMIVVLGGYSHGEVELTDIEDHWAEETIQNFVDAGFINGYPDGTFRPNQPITYREFLVVMARVTFPDKVWRVYEDNWSFAYTQELSPFDIVSRGDIYNYDIYIIREHIGKFMVRGLGQLPREGKTVYSDDAYIDMYTKAYINTARALGLVDGYADGSFRGFKSATRAEACMFLERYMDLSNSLRPIEAYNDLFEDSDYTSETYVNEVQADYVSYKITNAGAAGIVNQELPRIISKYFGVDLLAKEKIPYTVKLDNIKALYLAESLMPNHTYEDEAYVSDVVAYHLKDMIKTPEAYVRSSTPGHMEDLEYLVADDLYEYRKDFMFLIDYKKPTFLPLYNGLPDYHAIRIPYLYDQRHTMVAGRVYENDFDFRTYYDMSRDMYSGLGSLSKGEYVIKGGKDVLLTARSLFEGLPEHSSTLYNQSLAYTEDGTCYISVYGTLEDYIIVMNFY